MLQKSNKNNENNENTCVIIDDDFPEETFQITPVINVLKEKKNKKYYFYFK